MLSILFECCYVGDLFLFNDNIYVRVADSVEVASAKSFNAVNILSGFTIWINNDDAVKVVRD